MEINDRDLFSKGVLHVPAGAVRIPWHFLFLLHVMLSLEEVASVFLVRQVFYRPVNGIHC